MGLVLPQITKVRVSYANGDWYKSKGYNVPIKKASKRTYRKTGKEYVYDNNEYIDVDVLDLRDKETCNVNATCDYCGNEKEVNYRYYSRSIAYDGTYACSDCAQKKAQKHNLIKYGSRGAGQTDDAKEKRKKTIEEKYGSGITNVFQSELIKEKARNTMKEKYGHEYVSQVPEFREKVIATNLEKYGVENAILNPEIKEKANCTNFERYGTIYPAQNNEIKNKIANTNLERYGYESAFKSLVIQEKIQNTNLQKRGVKYPMQSEDVRNKSKETVMKKYGVDNVNKCPEIRLKGIQTLCKNGNVSTSKQQKYICELYNGILNYQISYYSADIVLLSDKIVVEYDGGGHDMRVKMGSISQEDFNTKERKRFYSIKAEGFKQIRLISRTDKLPSDIKLLEILDISKQYFDTTKHTWINWDIDESKYYNAEHPNGVLFDYGEVKKLSRELQDNAQVLNVS